MRADCTYPMHPANAERRVSFASHHSIFPKQLVYDPKPQEQGIAKCTYALCNVYAMQCVYAGWICVFSVPGKSRPAKTCASS